MKKYFLTIVCAIKLQIALFAGQYGYFTYVLNGDQITIIDCDTNAFGHLTIPSTLEGKSVTTIGSYVFYNCNNITEVTIPNTITSIGEHAFYYCRSLTNISIPNSVTTIGDSAFYQCPNLTYVGIGSGLTNVGSTVFTNCSKLEEFDVATTNAVYSSDGGVLFNKEKTRLIHYPAGIFGDYSIPSGVITIGYEAFRNCDNLTNLTIPQSITTIENRAFIYNSGLTSITIPDSVDYIGNSAFRDCRNLSKVIFNGSASDDFHYNAFAYTAFNFAVYHYEDSTGFSIPYWNNYESIELILDNDDDGDQLPNLLERSLRTSPLDQNSKLRIWLSYDGVSTSIHYEPHSEDCFFIVESTEELIDPESWEEVEGLSFSENQNERIAQLPTTNIKAKFYRVSVNEK